MRWPRGLGPIAGQFFALRTSRCLVNPTQSKLHRRKSCPSSQLTSFGCWVDDGVAALPGLDLGVEGRALRHLAPQHGSVELEHRVRHHPHRDLIEKNWKRNKQELSFRTFIGKKTLSNIFVILDSCNDSLNIFKGHYGHFGDSVISSKVGYPRASCLRHNMS